jgi:predicted RNase H-like nuclease (RuvC/YqgF family)
MEEKAAASEVFKRGWEACRADEAYQELKVAFQKEQKEWDKAQKRKGVKAEVVKGESIKEETVVKEEVKVKEESDQG